MLELHFTESHFLERNEETSCYKRMQKHHKTYTIVLSEEHAEI